MTTLNGDGFWYDRQRKRLILIEDHAVDAKAKPVKFRIDPREVELLQPVKDRELIIKLVCQRGFIRIRHTKGFLGWQFWGDPVEALEVMQRFFSTYDVGPATQVTFTDFALSGKINTTQGLAKDFAGPATAAQPLLARWASPDGQV